MAQFPGHKLASLSKYTTLPCPYRYHVFLSFRGEDTRKNFTDHLYTALINAGFLTFRDDPELERGENIKEKLGNAIQQSRSSIIVFSKDYTSSRWCLDELVMILQRKRTSDHAVIPVFYDVNPSQLKKQAETLANGWRAALIEVAHLAGMVLENEVDGHESKFIHKIVRVIQDKLSHVPLKDVEEVLQKKLSFINPHINVAEGKQLNNPDVKTWLTDLTEAGYDIEDLLQEIKTEALWRRMEAESSCSSKVQELNSSLPTLGFDSALIQSRVEVVLNRVDSIMDQRRHVLGLEVEDSSVTQTLPTTSLVDDSGVCGRDDEKEKLIKILISDNESGKKISVIPIVGMGGIGKTTLAQLLYNDDSVQKQFDIRHWVCVSKEFDAHKILQHIYESLKPDGKTRSPDQLQSELQKTLKGKRFFFVLDDIWNKNYNQLENLMLPFQSGGHGSKIIITTRDESIARKMGSVDAHHLVPMSEEDGWSLFEKHAFKNAGVGGQSHLKKIGRQIVRKCKGLPLAIKSLGGLLCSKSNADEWETVLNSEMWELPQEESDILPSLWLSYKYLPLVLKRCFAYCSIFPKNHKFKESKLILLWKAVGLLQPSRNQIAEEIGRHYFQDLISRSFLQHLLPDHVECYTMHDLFNDLARFVSGEFCARLEGSDSPKILSKTRHVNAGFDTFEASHQPESLRTLLLTINYSGLSSWSIMLRSRIVLLTLPKLQCLRVLKLSGYNEELPDSINNLKHLSHLDLSRTRIKKLPNTICTLYNLQALLLKSCEHLTELPAKLGRLINLSHLDIAGTKLIRMPRYMGNLKNLQTLPQFVLDRDTGGDNLPELEKLQSLRGRLYISGLEHSSGLEADILREKKFLNELYLYWGSEDEDEGRCWFEVLNEGYEESVLLDQKKKRKKEESVLEKLQPHLNLERLTIKRYGGKMFPGWPGFYSSSALVRLTLEKCMNCVSLPPLGQLPFLKELEISWLKGVVSIGSEFYYGEGRSATTCVNKPFRSLQFLTFKLMDGWKEWCTFVGGEDIVTFPKLTTLTMRYCYALECIREGSFPSKLKSLWIHGCRKLKMNSDCLRRLTSLKKLSLDFESHENREDWIASEDEGLLPSSLTHLEIWHLKCETIDKWFGHLNSLQSLVIWCSPSLRCLPESGLPPSLRKLQISSCRALRCLPESGLPRSLSQFEIEGCPLLEKRCQRETGEDWPKIAHIPEIWISGRKI